MFQTPKRKERTQFGWKNVEDELAFSKVNGGKYERNPKWDFDEEETEAAS